MSSVIFSNVNAMLEQVGRQYASSWAELDQLTCIWEGPTALSNNYQMGATHPTYPMMEINSIRKLSMVAGVTKLELGYVGLFSGAQQGPAVTELQWTESEIEYQTPYGPVLFAYSAIPNFADDGHGNQIVVSTTYNITWRYWALSTVVRYLSKGVSVRYVAYKPYGNGPGSQIPNTESPPSVITLAVRPGGTAQSAMVSSSYTLLANQSANLSQAPGNQLIYLGTGPWGFHSESYLSSLETDAISTNWYRVKALYTARLFAG